MKELGFNFRGKNAWPDITHVHSGMFPMLPEGQKLKDLVIVMQQTIDVLRRIQENPDLLFDGEMDDDVYLIRVNETGDPGQWKDTYSKVTEPATNFSMTYHKPERDKISRLPRSKGTLQADIALTPSKVGEPGKKAYFPLRFY